MEVSLCSTLTRVHQGAAPVQVVNTSREDVWLKPRMRIGIYQTIAHVSEEDRICFERVRVSEEYVSRTEDRPPGVVDTREVLTSTLDCRATRHRGAGCSTERSHLAERTSIRPR